MGVLRDIIKKKKKETRTISRTCYKYNKPKRKQAKAGYCELVSKSELSHIVAIFPKTETSHPSGKLIKIENK